MKKLLFFAFAISFAMVSCGNRSNDKVEKDTVDTVLVDSIDSIDSVSIDSVCTD